MYLALRVLFALAGAGALVGLGALLASSRASTPDQVVAALLGAAAAGSLLWIAAHPDLITDRGDQP